MKLHLSGRVSVIVVTIAISTTALGQTLYVPSGTSGVGTSGNVNVGIGTATPAQKLTIQASHGDTNFRLFSDLYGQGVDGSNTAIISLWASEPGWTWNGGGIGNNVVNAGGVVRVTTTRGGSYMRLLDNQIALNTIDSQGTDRSTLFLSNGNVGIGTSYPTRKFAVLAQYSEAVLKSVATSGGVGGSTLYFGNTTSDTAGWINYDHGANLLSVRVNEAERLRIDSYGNVGIGTTSPAAPLEVRRPGGAGAVQLNIDNVLGGATRDAFFTIRPDFASDQGGYLFRTHNGPSGLVSALSITAPGNVGIGTITPQHKLSVNGTIKAKEVIVETTGWSDYVFADDYRLAPLSEVEAHIKAEKRLPGIPSEQQVVEQGVSVGEMQAALLAKLEEVTLHLIRIEKDNARQTDEIARLVSENARLRNTLESLASHSQ